MFWCIFETRVFWSFTVLLQNRDGGWHRFLHPLRVDVTKKLAPDTTGNAPPPRMEKPMPTPVSILQQDSNLPKNSKTRLPAPFATTMTALHSYHPTVTRACTTELPCHQLLSSSGPTPGDITDLQTTRKQYIPPQ